MILEWRISSDILTNEWNDSKPNKPVKFILMAKQNVTI
jgi:hypothetical protein